MNDKYWELIDPDNVEPELEPIADLINWSLNEDEFTTYALFLDIIGWSDEMFNQDIAASYDRPTIRRGWMELGYLKNALSAYWASPQKCYDYLTKVWEAETDD